MFRTFKRSFGLALPGILAFSSAFAVQPHPKLVERLKAEGRWEEFSLQYEIMRQGEHPNPEPYRFKISSSLAAGAVPPDTLKVIVIYAAPSDRPTSADGINVTQSQLQNILFGSNPTGNMTDYYKEISYGQTVVTGQVFGPYTLPGTNAGYTFGAYGIPATAFTQDAIGAADAAGVDFSQFDANGDGRVDGLFIVHSGPGAEETGRTTDIWSHASSVGPMIRDGKTISNFAIQPEQQSFPSGPIQIGVFCHESGHALFGLPDLYDLDGSSQGAGFWCLMGSGNYANGSKTPVHMNPWCKKKIGWVTPVNPTVNQNNAAIPAVEYNPVIYRLWSNGSEGILKQYFLLENRRQKGFDSFAPGQGLLIWHIDESQNGNTNENRYLVGLEQADGQRHLNLGINAGDGGDPFPGNSNNRNFDEFSNPNSKTNFTNEATQVAVFNISNSDSVMTANIEVAYGRPKVTGFSSSIEDPSGDGDGAAEPGESANLYLSFTNAWLATTGWNVLVRIKDTLLVLTDSTAQIASLAGGGASTSTSPDPITFTVPANFGRSKLDSFFVQAWNFDSSHTFSGSWMQQIGATQMLLVDDDHGRTIENFYKAPFDTLLVPTRTWTVASKGVPPAESLALYPNVFWFTANDSASLLNSSRIASLSSYMDSGGNVVLSGQGIAQALWSSADSSFLRNYFHCRYVSSHSPAAFLYGIGASGNPISSGLKVILVGSGGANNQTQDDRVEFVDGQASKVFTYSSNATDTTGPLAIAAFADSNRRTIFTGFGLEAINSAAQVQGGARRSLIFSKILDWLESSTTTGLSVPFISAAPALVSFASVQGGTMPVPETLTVENAGQGGLVWSAALNPNSGWASISPSGGTAPSELQVSIVSTNLVPGTHKDTIVVTSTGAYNTPLKVVIQFTIAPGRGDLNADGIQSSTDVVLETNCTFLGTGSCGLGQADINCDGLLTSSDVVLLINWAFLGIIPPC